ncbi:hypothetical protein A3I18_01190 [Candidatus Campbellbacteria bacterium RIFCSPLOWO2_02_FULL_35_11]|uniref:Uncharacterized protein n=2 Tax=Candidatus Campbelliibacteriota TaxID=1752727 RepID=A0A1F5EP79_9BACT|nr:MAG: hypothetical protein A3E89_01615 [Candidatus Campbellbacteria bacterium RIFCSPHIGHO2_12_FULL_35_10]OGD70837.1 MAG: hypothetical protein A3I18_01190 [Candidatus Campbellbacteria bacterium RIFCSPLOWO2_02_FULL_35_11]
MKNFACCLVLLVGLIVGGCSPATYSYGIRIGGDVQRYEADFWLKGKKVSIVMDDNASYELRRDTVLQGEIASRFMAWGVVHVQEEEAEYMALVTGEDYDDRKVVAISVTDKRTFRVIARSTGKVQQVLVRSRYNSGYGEDYAEWCEAIRKAVAGLFVVKPIDVGPVGPPQLPEAPIVEEP